MSRHVFIGTQKYCAIGSGDSHGIENESRFLFQRSTVDDGPPFGPQLKTLCASRKGHLLDGRLQRRRRLTAQSERLPVDQQSI